jgi:hypothetical protein
MKIRKILLLISIFVFFMFLILMVHEAVHFMEFCDNTTNCKVSFFQNGLVGSVTFPTPLTNEQVISSEIKAYGSSFILAVACIAIELILINRWKI